MPVQILLVDDNSTLRYMARHLLHAELAAMDLEIIEAEDGQAALAACSDHDVDVVVLDMHMPGVPGQTVIELLKQGGNGPCVIAWSADDRALDRAVRIGADLAVLKGGDVDLLVEAITNCLSQP
jgi:CheY-like chemotaxis protein